MVLCVNEDERFFDPLVLYYMEQGKSTIVKKLLEDSGKFCDLTDSSGFTLLHYAAKLGNVKVMQYLIDSGSDVNAQDKVAGFTPLMLAMLSSSRKVIIKLLEANARVDIKNSAGISVLFFISLLPILSDVRIGSILPRLMLQLKRDCGNDSESMAKHLLDAGCSLYASSLLKSRTVTDIMLKSRAIKSQDLSGAFTLAVANTDLPMVKLLMEYGAIETYSFTHPLALVDVQTKITPQKLELLEILISQSNAGRPEFQEKVYDILGKCSPEVAQVLIRYVDLRTEVVFERPGGRTWKTTYLHSFMSNPKEGIIKELPMGINFDFTKVNSLGDSCLARAACACNLTTVEFLIGKGVGACDVNEAGDNVLMSTIAIQNIQNQQIKSKIINVLLKHGADVQFINKINNKTVFDLATPKNISLMKSMVAQLAMLESLGKPIIQLIYDKLKSHPMFKSHFKLSKLRLGRMKQITVHKSVTLYKLLTESDAKVMLYVQNCEFAHRFNCLMQGRRRSNSLYDFLLRRRTFECIHAARMKREAADVLTEILQIDNHTMIHRVLGYLRIDDWRSLQHVKL